MRKFGSLLFCISICLVSFVAADADAGLYIYYDYVFDSQGNFVGLYNYETGDPNSTVRWTYSTYYKIDSEGNTTSMIVGMYHDEYGTISFVADTGLTWILTGWHYIYSWYADWEDIQAFFN